MGITAACDHLSSLHGPAGDLTHAAGIIDELSAEEFDAVTIAEAMAAAEEMLAAAQAARRAGIDAHRLLEVAGEF